MFPLRLIGYALSEMPHSLAGWRRVREVLDEPIEPDPAAAIEPAPDGLGVQLDSIHFTFPGELRPAIDDVDLAVEKGRMVAIVGPTGAGKTTLVEIVAGLVPPGSGVVRLGAGPRAVVTQEAFLFSGTIRHNLGARAGRSRNRTCGRRCAWPAPTTSSPRRRTASTRWSGSAASA